ncbi:efflux RND transporter periplasmic adaptor subunit [Herminiimonas sp. CN]|uniref:efflux RND transporter periplasmic adaptor subunit n=1 Tax=Herminiimonas sp. CN TaxID=1349818 RepID=UPI0004732FE4|nr:efflux RND transporter periplasmic adaptor subunit [Herminiimonas sp. CN]
MHLNLKYVLIAAGVVALGAGAAYYVMHFDRKAVASKARDTSQSVKTVLSERKSMPITIAVNGNVVAINTVDVRPQIQNVVRAIHVVEGQQVRAGQLLFTLDERGDASAVAKAQAQLAKDRADLEDAESALKRNQDLLAKNFVSQAVVDTARSRVEAARSVIRADQAGIEASDVALGYNRIAASISGRIGAIAVHVGSLAQPGGVPMLTISQLDPIAVGFAVPERELANIVTTYSKLDAPVSVQLPNGQAIEGKLSFVDNAADAATGTIRMKAQFANPQKLLWPGAFVNVRLISRTLPAAVVVPAQAIITGPSEQFVYLVRPDSTVQSRKVDIVTIENGLAAVSGLEPGQRVVLEGAQNLRPGAKVKEIGQALPATENARPQQKNPS